MIQRPTERSEQLEGVKGQVTILSEIAIRIDKIRPETIHAIEVAKTPDEKANAIHAAIAEAMDARAAEKTE